MIMNSRQVVWIAGGLGRMGRAIEHHLKQDSYILYTTDKEVDITNLDAVNAFADQVRPNYIINCVGYRRDLMRQEPDPLEAYRINTLGARNLAIASEGVDAVLIHLSTDDLFLGSTESLVNEFDTPSPIDVFGKSKYAGERFVRSLNPRHLIIRTQWVYTALPTDYLAAVAKAAQEGRDINLPVNQIASPTSAHVLADFVETAMEAGEYGTFHASCEGRCSRFEFFKKALELMGLPTTHLIGAHKPDDAYNIQLDNLMMKLTDIYAMPRWDEELERYLNDHKLCS